MAKFIILAMVKYLINLSFKNLIKYSFALLINDYGDQRRNAKAVWTELAEISVDGYGALSNFETP